MSLFGSIGGIASLIGTGVQAGSSIYGAIQGADAADEQAKLARQAHAASQKNLAPYRAVGKTALRDLRDIYLTGAKPFTESPDYDYRVSEGQKALERSAASRGMLNSGATLRQLQEYGQGEATAEYDRGFNRLAALAGYGERAVPQANQASQNLAVNVGNAGYNAAQARASGFEGVGNALTDLGNNAITLDALRRYGQPYSGPGLAPPMYGGGISIRRR